MPKAVKTSSQDATRAAQRTLQTFTNITDRLKAETFAGVTDRLAAALADTLDHPACPEYLVARITELHDGLGGGDHRVQHRHQQVRQTARRR